MHLPFVPILYTSALYPPHFHVVTCKVKAVRVFDGAITFFISAALHSPIVTSRSKYRSLIVLLIRVQTAWNECSDFKWQLSNKNCNRKWQQKKSKGNCDGTSTISFHFKEVCVKWLSIYTTLSMNSNFNCTFLLFLQINQTCNS